MATKNQKKMQCNCGKIDYSLYVSGCPDCGEDREVAAQRLTVKPSELVAGKDFIPNKLCRDCCPSGHCTKFSDD